MGGWGHVRALQPSLPSRILPICTTFLGGKAHARHVPGQSGAATQGVFQTQCPTVQLKIQRISPNLCSLLEVL